MYIMIHESGDMVLLDRLTPEDLLAADDGYVDLIDVSMANEPMRYFDEGWTNIDVPNVQIEGQSASGLSRSNAGLGQRKVKMKRKDECVACSKRACYERVVSTDGGRTYDEVACIEHVRELHKDSDVKVPGVQKHFICGTRKQKRGVAFHA